MEGVRFTISVAVSVLPALAILALFRRLDRARPVPRRLLYATLVLGAAACVPAAMLEWAEHELLGDASLVGGRFVDAFAVAAFTEESLKLIVVLRHPLRRGGIDEVLDGIVYAVAASLGFGLLENLAFSADDIATGVARAITAVPMHAVASGVMGYFVGRARFVPTSEALPLALAGLFLAIVIHGSYDWAVFNHDAHWFAESMGVLAGASALLAALVRHALRLDNSMHGRLSLVSISQWPTDVTETLQPSAGLPKDAPPRV